MQTKIAEIKPEIQTYKAIPLEQTKKKPRGVPFVKGHKGAKPKGTKNTSTKIKEQLGLTGWNELVEYVSNEGAKKYTIEVNSLEGEAYIRGFTALLEYVKPKQVRSEGNVTNIQINNITFE